MIEKLSKNVVFRVGLVLAFFLAYDVYKYMKRYKLITNNSIPPLVRGFC